MKKVIMYSKPGCPYCVRAKRLLDAMHVSYDEKMVGNDVTLSEVVTHCSSVMESPRDINTVPQMILINNGLHTYIGGYDDLVVKQRIVKG